jgi:hypothetical protein
MVTEFKPKFHVERGGWSDTIEKAQQRVSAKG